MGNSSSKQFLKDPATYASILDEENPKSYDYVIIGGGTAGSVLASRLSENPEVSVLVLEAGMSPKDYFMTRSALAWPTLLHGPADWNFYSTPQSNLADRKIYVPRGKVLGGTSSINAAIYHHCSPEDFDEWVREGAEGWSYEEIRPYFKKSEKYTPPSPSTKFYEGRGRDGLWSTTDSIVPPCGPAFIQACENLGIHPKEDFNTPEGTNGAGYFMGIVDPNGRRSSAATAFLTPPSILSRLNLHVGIGIRATKILFKKSDSGRPKAYGVHISTGPQAKIYVVYANKEIILCGGAYGTPHLLQVSGVGPKDVLGNIGIKDEVVVADLPAVGRNLYDHFSPGPIILRAKGAYTLDNVIHNPLNAMLELLRWQITGGGPFSTLVANTVAFVRSDDPKVGPLIASKEIPTIKDTSSGAKSPDMEILMFSCLVPPDGEKKPSGVYGLSLGGVILKPTSSGSVTAKTGSIWDAPDIDVNYFADENEIALGMAATRLILRIARTSPFKDILMLKDHSKDQDDLFWPGDADPDLITDEEIREFIRRKSQTVFHPTSSARMGKSRETSVVDTELRIHGIDGIRIVDASVFPKIVSGHPCAVVVAVAERAAELIAKGAK